LKSKSYETQYSKFTQDEIAAIFLYTCDMKQLPSENLYYIINAALREEKQRLLPYIMPYVHLLIRAISKLPTIQALLYRGITDVELHSESFKEGQIVTWAQFSSCSPVRSVAQEFFKKKRNKSTLFQIETKYGHNISEFSSYPSEGEIMILPGAKFRVERFIFDDDLCVVYLTQIEDLFTKL